VLEQLLHSLLLCGDCLCSWRRHLAALAALQRPVCTAAPTVQEAPPQVQLAELHGQLLLQLLLQVGWRAGAPAATQHPSAAPSADAGGMKAGALASIHHLVTEAEPLG
jgi:hypothetical protein